MKKSLSITQKLIATCVVLLLFLGMNTSYGQGVNAATNCVPPGGGSSVPGGPEYVGQFHAHYPNGGPIYDLSQPQHSMFTSCDPPPPAGSGATTVHSFGSTVRATATSAGGTIMQIQAPAQVTVRMTDAGPNGSGGEMYQTEMLQLDIQNGSLPPGVMIRESPTLQSTGQTNIKPNGSGFQIDSFFDIFTELSVDGGATWVASTTGPGRMTLTTPGSGIPTLSQWGLIIFSLLFLAITIVFLKRRSTQITPI